MSRSCPHVREAALAGPTLPTEAQARRCPTCADVRAEVLALRALAEDLGPPPPSPARVDQIRGALDRLRPPRRPARPRWRWPLIAAASIAAAALAVWLAAPPAPPAPVVRASIAAAPSSRFTHQAALVGHPEQVTLVEGTLAIEVSPLGAGERFVVSTIDAEIEVRGTRFEVSAENGVLTAVWVRSGGVELRRRGALPVILWAGERWSPPAPSAAPPPPPAPIAPSPAPPANTPPTRAAPERNVRVVDGERAFRDAWAAFARGDFGAAAERFAAAEAADPRGDLAEDAAYGRAVSLERAGRSGDAVAEMRRFLSRYPGAARADEVAAALGWLLIEDQPAEAAAWLERAASSPSDHVRQSAARGLEALRR